MPTHCSWYKPTTVLIVRTFVHGHLYNFALLCLHEQNISISLELYSQLLEQLDAAMGKEAPSRLFFERHLSVVPAAALEATKIIMSGARAILPAQPLLSE